MCCTNDLAGHKTENVSDKVTEDMVGCLCEFWNDDEPELKLYSVLQEIDSDMTMWFDCEECEKSTPYYAGQGLFFQHCKPLEEKEVKFYKQENYHKLTEKEFKDFVETKEYVDSLKRQEELKAEEYEYDIDLING